MAPRQNIRTNDFGDGFNRLSGKTRFKTEVQVKIINSFFAIGDINRFLQTV